MPDRKKRISYGFSTVLGAAAAFFGMRALLQWYRSRSLEEDRQQRVMRRMAQPDPEASYQPRDQPDRQPERQQERTVPATGVGVDAHDMARSANQPTVTVEVQEMVAPLAQYLLAFHQLIEMLRSRRQGSGAQSGARTLSEADRGGFQETLDRLEALIPDYGPGNLPDDSLQERIYRLTVKVRDALQNRSYGDDDLFRINGEVRAESCRMLAEIQWAGADTGPEFEQVRQAYNCG